MNKRVGVMEDFGILRCGHGLYRLVDGFLVPGQRMLDLGAVVLRLDRLDEDLR